MKNNSFYCRYIKGTLDKLIAVMVIVCFWWLYLLIAIAIKIEDPKGPVIFQQERIGQHGKVYWMYKFRSMRVGTEHTGSGVYSDSKDERVTKVGRFLRSTSLDELPQFINILKGDISLIGFRSPLTYHPWPWEQYTEEQKKMFALKPGITGWAQVNGRRSIEWNRRIEYNVWYAENVSFLLDLKIILYTVLKVITRVDNENTGATVIGAVKTEENNGN